MGSQVGSLSHTWRFTHLSTCYLNYYNSTCKMSVCRSCNSSSTVIRISFTVFRSHTQVNLSLELLVTEEFISSRSKCVWTALFSYPLKNTKLEFFHKVSFFITDVCSLLDFRLKLIYSSRDCGHVYYNEVDNFSRLRRNGFCNNKKFLLCSSRFCNFGWNSTYLYSSTNDH